MKIAIPLGSGSKWENNELRYAVRGFDKHLAGMTGIVIIGNKPIWLRADEIKVNDLPYGKNKERNIWAKLFKACKYLNEPFLFANDDHFLLKDYNIQEFPNYCSGTIGAKKCQKGNAYHITIKNTLRLIGDAPNFDVHCPIIIEPERFLKMEANWRQAYGYMLKSVYARGLAGVHMPDLKHQSAGIPDLSNRPWFSVGDNGLTDEFKLLLNSIYPEPSHYEL